MKSRIIIHATNTPSDTPLTLDDIMSLNSQDRYRDPMPYHYVINIDGKILKGKRDNELCGHCGKFSRDSISVAYVGGVNDERLPIPDERCLSRDERLPMNEVQEEALHFIIKNLMLRNPNATVVGANALLHPDEDPAFNEPYFDVKEWYSAVGR